MNEPRWLRVACRVYRGVLALLPEAFRIRYATEMLEVFRRGSLHARNRGWPMLARFWTRAFTEGLAVAIRVRWGEGVRGASRHWRMRWRWSAVARDLEYAVRAAWRKPAVPLAVIVTMALGIGATTVAFSVIHGVLLRPLPYPDPDRLVRLLGFNVERGVEFGAVNHEDVTDWDQQVEELDAAAAYVGTSVTLTGLGIPERIRAGIVSGRFFDVLRTRPALGRLLTVEDTRLTSDQVVVLSHGFWQRRFGGRAVLGRTIRLDDESHIIVGVLPPSRYQIPSNEYELWLPMRIDPVSWQYGRGPSWVSAIGRLQPGVEIAEVQTSLEVVTSRLAEAYPETNRWRSARVRSFHGTLVASSRPLLLLLAGTVAVVLVLGCSSVANLLLAQATERRREFALRAVLGAGRGRLVRQLLTEAMLLTVTGGLAGVGLAVVGLDLVLGLAGNAIPRQSEIGMSVSVLVFAAGISLATGILFGLVPAVRVARVELTSDIKGAQGASGRRGVLRLRELLVGVQVVLSLVLLIGAALLGKSLWLLASVDPGFRTTGVITIGVTPPASRYPSSGDVVRFYDQLLAGLGAVPGVAATAMADRVPLESGTWTDLFTIDGQERPEPGHEPAADFRRITPDYFAVLGISIERGRPFGRREGAKTTPVVLVNETLARRYIDGDPVGRTLRYGDIAMTIVGVAGDVRQRDMAEEPMATVYFPWAQSTGRAATVLLRTERAPAGLVGVVRETVRNVDPNLALSDVVTMQERIASVLGPPRFRALIVGSLAGLACILSIVGVYGVVAYTVRQRTREIGIRVALGSDPGAVMWFVVRHALSIGAVAVGVGTLLSLGTARLLRAFLFDVSVTDPAVLLGAPILFLALIVLASVGPARAAARIEPLGALRSE